MTTYLRPISAIVPALILAGCAAGGSPKPATEAPLAQNAKCIPQTGTRIAGQEPDFSVVGRCYSKTDIVRTGATTVAGILPRLDPSITVEHH